ncbi:MAG TPA: hypothetical protein VF043_31320 [Ktedonobacteraceae bacterium]
MKTLSGVNMKGTINQAPTSDSTSASIRRRMMAPFVILLLMICAILLMDAVVSLRSLWFQEALLTQLGTWPAWPSLTLFPGWAIIPPLPYVHISGPPDIAQSWLELSLLLGTFIAVFAVYILALRRLPERITRRYLIYSTLLLGLFYMLIPVVTSPDLYSYIAYARIGVLYHLNPLTTLPSAIQSDAIYSYVAWIDQPSAYGPTWAIITSGMQGIFSLFGLNLILPMVIMLRLFGLLIHVLSTMLIWSISGHLLARKGLATPAQRMRAALAFAWNPLLLFEACVNAHNDATVLFFVLLAIWFLVRHMRTEAAGGNRDNRGLSLWSVVFAAAMLAVATCLKLYVVLFVPGLFFFLWMQSFTKSERSASEGLASEADHPYSFQGDQRHPFQGDRKGRPYHRRPGLAATIFRGDIKTSLAAIATYIGIIVALYAPFWQGGAILDVFSVNPATYRSINSLPEFLAQLYNALVAQLGFPLGAAIGSPAEHLTHTLSLLLFVLIYCFLCWRIIRAPGSISTLSGLTRWMVMVWLLYCVIGSPWFWPWYMVTFFGLYAVIEASSDRPLVFLNWLPWPLMVRLLAFSMLSLYCFIAWGPRYSYVPGLPGFLWSYFSGLWVWVVPLLGAAVLVLWRKRPSGLSVRS